MIKKDFTHRDAERHLINSRPRSMSAHSNKLESARAISSRRFVPLHTARKNLWHINESLDVIDHRRFLPQAHNSGKRRFVSRFRTMSLDGFDQRAFFAANISARTDKHAQLKFASAAKNIFSEQSSPIAAPNLFTKDFFLQMIFMPYIKNSLRRTRHESRKNHSLHKQVRKLRHDKPIFDRARLALVGVANDIFFRPRLLANQIPFHGSRESRAAHTAQFCFLQQRQHAIPVLRRDRRAKRSVLFRICIRIGRASHTRLLRVTVVKFITTQRRTDHGLRVIGSNIRKDMIIHRDRRRLVAAAEARDIADFHFTAPRIRKTPFNIGAQFACAIQVTAHVRTYADFRSRWRGEMKMRIKASYAVNLVQRRPRARRQRFQLRLGQKPVAKLDSPQVVEDHCAASRKKSAKRRNMMPPSEMWSANSLAY